MKDYTPARANKTLGFLADERRRLLDLERDGHLCFFVEGEAPEADDPEYSYVKTRERLAEIDRKTAALRHALHAFSARAVLPEAGMTLDEGHIRLSLMGKEKRRLAALRDTPKKRRVSTGLILSGPKSEYECANFDVKSAERDYLSLCEGMAELSLEIARVEQTETFSVDL